MKGSWEKPERALAEAGFRSLALDFRGEGQSRGGTQTLPPDEERHFDVLAAVHYLRRTGAKSVAVVGASMGGDYAAEAAEAEPGAIDRLVLLAAGAYTPLIRMKGRKLFIMKATSSATTNLACPRSANSTKERLARKSS